MKITDIITASAKPAIYEKGTAFMWTDRHISKQLLNIHLDPEIDLGSRKMPTIEKTANWILDTQDKKGALKILDLGCGPGLYSEIFAQKGHSVTGVDISTNSIDYARKSANEKQLDIDYINASYLELDLGTEKYDLVVLIYTDFGVLPPKDRERLLKMVYQALKTGGMFIFDVLKDNDLEKRVGPKNWEVVNSGFWRERPYIALSESFLYNDEKVVLYQHIVIDENGSVETYRFWTHFFSQEDIWGILGHLKFGNVQFRDNILPKSDMWNGDNVIFSLAEK